MTDNNENDTLSTTGDIPFDSDMTEASTTNAITNATNTTSAPPQDVRTVPVDSRNKSIMLKYAPEEADFDESDVSTDK